MAVKEITEKVEAKRQEIKVESERLRKEATENHTCANCGNSLPSGRRTYCSDACSMQFTEKYDYSVNSEILKKYRMELQTQYEISHPKKEREPWTEPVAKKDHPCSVCGLIINKGEKYHRYVRLPEIDEDFDDAPYETLCYHSSCLEFITRLFRCDAFLNEGYTEDDINGIYEVFSWEFGLSIEQMKQRVREGNVPTEEQISQIGEKYGWDFEISIPIGSPLFLEVS